MTRLGRLSMKHNRFLKKWKILPDVEPEDASGALAGLEAVTYSWHLDGIRAGFTFIGAVTCACLEAIAARQGS